MQGCPAYDAPTCTPRASQLLYTLPDGATVEGRAVIEYAAEPTRVSFTGPQSSITKCPPSVLPPELRAW